MPSLSFEVGAIFMIEDRGTPALERLGEAFTALDAKVNALQEKLASVGSGEGLFSAMAAGVEQVTGLFNVLAERATVAGDAMEAAFRRGSDAAVAAARNVDALTEAINRAAGASDRMGGGGGGGRRGRGRGGATEPEFDEGDYDRPGTGLASFGYGWQETASGYMGARAGARRPGMPVPTGSAASEEEQLLLDRPRMGGGWTGHGGAGPPGVGGSGFIPPRDEPFDPRLSVGGQQGRGSSSHIAPLVEAAAVYEAMKAGAEEEQSVDITLLRGFHIDPRTATDEQKSYLRELARKGSEGTSFSEREVAGGEEILAAPLGFTGDEGMRKFGTVFEAAAKAAEAAKQLHFGTFEGSLKGSVEFAHQMQLYDAPGLTKGMNLLGAVTESLPGGDMEREAQVMSYAIPQARALGADPGQAMEAVGFMQRAGLRNTVAATTLRQMMVGQLKTGGPMNAQHRAIDHERRELEDSLGLKPGHLERPAAGSKGNAHEKALEDLGLVDKGGKLLDLNERGGFDLQKMFEIIAAQQQKMTPIEFGKSMFNAFGIRGQTGGELIGEALPRYKTYQQGIHETPPLDEQLKMISGSSVQLTGQAVARVADLGNEIGTTLLPYLKQFDEAIILATGYLRKLAGEHPEATAAVVGGGVAASVVGGVMAMRAMPHWIAKLFSEGSAEKAGEGLRSVGTRATSWIGGSLGLLGEAIAPMMIGWDVQQHLRDPKYLDPKTGEFDMRRVAFPPTQPATGADRLPGPRADTLTDGTPRSASGPAQVTVHLGPVTMNGVPDDSSLHALMKKLTDGIHDAISHMGSDAAGTAQSPFIYPGAF